MLKLIVDLETLEAQGIDIKKEFETQETIQKMQEVWNEGIDLYLNSTNLKGLYEVLTESMEFIGYLEEEEKGEVK